MSGFTTEEDESREWVPRYAGDAGKGRAAGQHDQPSTQPSQTFQFMIRQMVESLGKEGTETMFNQYLSQALTGDQHQDRRKGTGASSSSISPSSEEEETEEEETEEEETEEDGGSEDERELHRCFNEEYDYGEPLPETPALIRTSAFDDRMVATMQRIVGNIPTSVRSKCHFQLEAYVLRLVQLFSGENREGSQQLFCGGQTQVGKTAFKAVALIVGKELGFFSVIVTTTESGRKSLAAKIADYVKGTKTGSSFLVSKPTDKNVNKTFEAHGGVVIADTAAQMESMARRVHMYSLLVPESKWLLIVDEADELIRTSDSKRLKENAFLQLQSRLPCTRTNRVEHWCPPALSHIQISATLIPVLLRCQQQQATPGLDASPREHVDGAAGSASADQGVAPSVESDLLAAENFFFTKAAEDQYHSAAELQPLKIDGEVQYLRRGEIIRSTLYQNKQTKAMYLDAASKKRSLLLDVTSPSVNVTGNIFAKAADVQKKMHLKGHAVCVVAASGGGIAFKPPIGHNENDAWVIATGKPCKDLKATTHVHWPPWMELVNCDEVIEYEKEQMLTENIAKSTTPSLRCLPDRLTGSLMQTVVPLKELSALDRKVSKEFGVGDLLRFLDSMPGVGLDTPVFLFGYSRVQRGESFRSAWRVPTHIINQLSPGLSREKVVQSIGRASFIGKPRLALNGFSCVTSLVPKADANLSTSYQEFVDSFRLVLDRLDRPSTLAEVLEFDTFSGNANVSTGVRPLGQAAAELEHIFTARFEPLMPGADLPEEYRYTVQEIMASSLPMQREISLALLRKLQELAREHGQNAGSQLHRMSAKDLKEFILKQYGPLGLPRKPTVSEITQARDNLNLLVNVVRFRVPGIEENRKQQMWEINQEFADWNFDLHEQRVQRTLAAAVLTKMPVASECPQSARDTVQALLSSRADGGERRRLERVVDKANLEMFNPAKPSSPGQTLVDGLFWALEDQLTTPAGHSPYNHALNLQDTVGQFVVAQSHTVVQGLDVSLLKLVTQCAGINEDQVSLLSFCEKLKLGRAPANFGTLIAACMLYSFPLQLHLDGLRFPLRLSRGSSKYRGPAVNIACRPAGDGRLSFYSLRPKPKATKSPGATGPGGQSPTVMLSSDGSSKARSPISARQSMAKRKPSYGPADGADIALLPAQRSKQNE